MLCRFCSTPIPSARAEIYSHCVADNCVTMWQRERLDSYRLALVPKSGFQIVQRDDDFLTSGGRSSGRST
jgi:hypothetical protein